MHKSRYILTTIADFTEIHPFSAVKAKIEIAVFLFSKVTTYNKNQTILSD